MELKTKKILFFLGGFDRGGAEWVITNLANEFGEYFGEVTLISVRDGVMHKELNNRVRSNHFNGSLKSALKHLACLLRKNKYDYIFTTQRVISLYAWLTYLFSFSQTKRIVREAASNFEHVFKGKNFFQKSMLRFLYRQVYNRASIVICNSDGTKADLITSGIISNQKKNVFTINNPLDLDSIRTRAIQKNPFNTPDKYIISIGRLVPQKNMSILIKAFINTEIYRKGYHLLILGQGPEEKSLKELVKQQKMSDKIHILGHTDNPYPALRNAKLFVLASEWEGFGMVVVEALALGVPVIVADINSGPKYIVDNGRYGRLVKPGSTSELTFAIKEMISKPFNQHELIKRAEAFEKNKIALEYISAILSD